MLQNLFLKRTTNIFSIFMTLFFHYFFVCVSFEYVLIPTSTLPARPMSLFVCPRKSHYFFFSSNFLPKGQTR